MLFFPRRKGTRLSSLLPPQKEETKTGKIKISIFKSLPTKRSAARSPLKKISIKKISVMLTFPLKKHPKDLNPKKMIPVKKILKIGICLQSKRQVKILPEKETIL